MELETTVGDELETYTPELPFEIVKPAITALVVSPMANVTPSSPDGGAMKVTAGQFTLSKFRLLPLKLMASL